jgi:putative spermidine/putrescine transport system substrate-binding protein
MGGRIMSIMRKTVLLRWAVLGLAYVALLYATAWPAASTPGATGEITLYAYPGIFQDKYTKAVIEPFLRTHPGLRVNYEAPGNSAQMLARLRAERNDPQADVVIMDVSIASQGNKEGLFAPLDPSAVSHLTDLYPEAVTPGHYGPSVTFDHFVLIYNTDLVRPAPTSWADLWNPALRGRIIVTAPPDIQGLVLTILVDRMQGADYKKTIDPAIARLRALAPLVQTWNPSPDQYTLVLSGQAAMAVGWNARSQLYADQSRGKLGVVLPKEGSVFQKNTINLVKGSRNPRAAQAFIDYALGPEAQKRFTETMYYAPVNRKVMVSAQVLRRTASSPTVVQRMLPVDWTYVSQVRDQWLERWQKDVMSR